MNTSLSRWSILVGVLALIPVLAGAQVEPKYSAAVAAKLIQPETYVIGDHYVKWAEAGEASSLLETAGLEAMGSSPDLVFVDERTGRIGTMIASLPIVPGAGNGITWASLGLAAKPTTTREIESVAWPLIESALRSFSSTLGIDPEEMVSPGKVTALDDGRLLHVWVPRQVDGIPVRDSYLTAVIRHGNLVLLGTRNWGDVTVARSAGISSDLAEASLTDYLGSALPIEGWWRRPGLELITLRAGGIEAGSFQARSGLTHRLAWVLGPTVRGEGARLEALVDAASGEVFALADTLHYGTGSTREVVGGVFPVSNDGIAPDGVEQAEWPMPFAFVTNGANTLLTDAGGNVATCIDGTIGATLVGPYVRIADTCGAVSESTSGGVLDFGTSAGTDCTVPSGASAGNTHAARTGFHELNRLYEMARSHVPQFDFLHQQILSNMNVNSTCNASSGGPVLNFFKSGGGCRNTGEIAGVFDHEWGHSLDSADSVPSVSNPGEGIADIYASLRLNTSCIGRGFRSTNCSGYGNACSACTGVRDIDWADHTANTPIVITGSTATAIEVCSAGPAPCGGSVHCEGQVYSQAVWDLWNRDLIAAPFSFNVDRTREIAARLTFNGATNVSQWYNCSDPAGSNNAVGDGCNAGGGYLNYIAADDDDGNLANGTPHMTAIHAAFNRHGIACATPTVQNSGCAGRPTTAPTLTATAADRGALLSWTAVTGAQRYRILRTDGVFTCNFGKAIVAEIPASDPLTYLDGGALNGRDYSYQVVAVGTGDSCYGPVSTCQTVTPTAGANVAGIAGSDAISPTTGDADVFFDNCEQADLSFDVENIGNATLTNVRVVSVDTPDGVFVLDTLPVAVSASLASCSTATATLSLYLAFQDPDAEAELVVHLGADELGATTRPVTITLANLESNFQFSASKTFGFEVDMEDWSAEMGTIVRATAGGGAPGSTIGYLRSSNGIDNQCDVGRSPLLQLASDSTLQMFTNFTIEPQGGGTWYDRANVAVLEGDGTRTVVTPSSGRAYNASAGGGGCLGTQAGWAGTMASWASSTWSAAALGSAGLAGAPIQLEVSYATDGGSALDGFRFDAVTVTNVSYQTPDTQSNICVGGPGIPIIFMDGFETGNTSAWSSTVP